jgi:hypothetical protein
MAKEWVFVIWLALAGTFPPPSTAAEKRLLCMEHVSNVEFTRDKRPRFSILLFMAWKSAR